jgi:hypothetical protein
MARYVTEMGADIEIFRLAMRIPPWETLRPLNKDELRKFNVQTVDTPFDATPLQASAKVPATLEAPATTGATPASVPKSHAATFADRAPAMSDRQWGLVDRSGGRTLLRRHPLTVEGEEIGNFELAFACNDTAEAFVATYVEHRRANASSEAEELLRSVRISVGSQRALLKVESSLAGEAPQTLVSVARGKVPLALMNTLAESGRHSVVIETITTAKARTEIRVGDAGLAANAARMKAACTSKATASSRR